MVTANLSMKILGWLNTEPSCTNVKQSHAPEPPHGHNIPIVNFTFRRTPMQIVYPSDRSDSFIILATVTLANNLLELQKLLDMTQRTALMAELSMSFGEGKAQFNADIDNKSHIMKRVTFDRILWEDGLSKNEFFQTLISIKSTVVKTLNKFATLNN